MGNHSYRNSNGWGRDERTSYNRVPSGYDRPPNPYGYRDRDNHRENYRDNYAESYNNYHRTQQPDRGNRNNFGHRGNESGRENHAQSNNRYEGTSGTDRGKNPGTPGTDRGNGYGFETGYHTQGASGSSRQGRSNYERAWNSGQFASKWNGAAGDNWHGSNNSWQDANNSEASMPNGGSAWDKDSQFEDMPPMNSDQKDGGHSDFSVDHWKDNDIPSASAFKEMPSTNPDPKNIGHSDLSAQENSKETLPTNSHSNDTGFTVVSSEHGQTNLKSAFQEMPSTNVIPKNSGFTDSLAEQRLNNSKSSGSAESSAEHVLDKATWRTHREKPYDRYNSNSSSRSSRESKDSNS